MAVVASARRPALAESLNMRRGWSRAPHHRNASSPRTHRSHHIAGAQTEQLQSGLGASDNLPLSRQVQAAGTRGRHLAALHSRHRVPEHRPHHLPIACEVLAAR
ncbi:hypothetical protein LMG918_19900 [Xanthomonas euvesicatoria]|nr:hypothetical protein LMG918_19900 [Xanthomonas euvesicatoria]